LGAFRLETERPDRAPKPTHAGQTVPGLLGFNRLPQPEGERYFVPVTCHGDKPSDQMIGSAVSPRGQENFLRHGYLAPASSIRGRRIAELAIRSP
jgi:hypothetical protein